MKMEKLKKVFIIARFFALFLFFILFSTSDQAIAKNTNYYIDISLFSEGYAEFKIDVDNYGNLGETVIELPTLKCEYNFTYVSDLRKKIKVSDIPDEQTLEGRIDLKPNCMGVGITKPSDNSKDFAIFFTYRNFDWELHPEYYPFDNYKMPILISFPEVRTEDSAFVYTRVLLPLNTKVKNISAYQLWEHPANTQYKFNDIDFTLDKYGNQLIIVLESSYLTKNNSPQAIYLPLEFEPGGVFTNIFYNIYLTFNNDPNFVYYTNNIQKRKY